MSDQHEEVALVTGKYEHYIAFELSDGVVIQVNKIHVSEEEKALVPTLLISPDAEIAMVKRAEPEQQVYAKVPGSVIARARKKLVGQERSKSQEDADA